MLLTIPAGSTSKIVEFPVFDSSSAVGALLAGLAYNSGSLTAHYDRVGASGGGTSMSLVTMTKGTWTSLGFVAVDGTNMPGIYQLGIPDAALAAGATQVTIYLKGAANMVPVVIVIQLISVADYPANVTQLDGASLSTHASGMIPADLRDIAGAAVSTSTAQLGVNAVQIGAAVPGSATIGTVTNLTNLPTIPTDWIAAAGVKADAVTKIQANLATLANQNTILGYIDTEVAAILAAVDAEVAAIKAKTDSLTFTTAGQVDAQVLSAAAGAINNAAFNADVSTAGNRIPTAVFNALDAAFTDATSLTSNGLFERLRTLSWILRNKMTVDDATGNVVIYKDDNSTAAFTVSAALTDNSTTTTRLRMA